MRLSCADPGSGTSSTLPRRPGPEARGAVSPASAQLRRDVRVRRPIDRITQEREEIQSLWMLIRALRPTTVVEIGVDEGGTLFIWTRASAPDAQLIGIDMRPSGRLGRWSPFQLARRSFAQGHQRLHLLLARDSHAESTLEAVREVLDGAEIDFLFIEGDHSYEGVRRDFEMYGRSFGTAGSSPCTTRGRLQVQSARVTPTTESSASGMSSSPSTRRGNSRSGRRTASASASSTSGTETPKSYSRARRSRIVHESAAPAR